MNIIIVGGGRSGSYIAERFKDKNKVTVIEQKHEQVELLLKQLPEVRIIKGDGCEPGILEKANIMQTDIVAVLTGDDEDNLVISYLAKFQNKVPLVLSRINNPKNEWLFNSSWGVDVALSSSIIMEPRVVNLAILFRIEWFGSESAINMTLGATATLDPNFTTFPR